MDAEFWQQRWQQNQIGFHQPEINTHLKAHFTKLELAQHARIFVPLSGKTLDIGWLLHQGYQVCAVELSMMAIEQLFTQLALPYQVSSKGKLQHFQAENLDIFVGDFFDLDSENLGKVDAIYDRAALVALPQPMRTDYAAHLVHLTNAAPQLLIHYNYDQSLFDGPPFSISDQELMQLYASYPQKILLETERLTQDGLNQRIQDSSSIDEKVWLLRSF